MAGSRLGIVVVLCLSSACGRVGFLAGGRAGKSVAAPVATSIVAPDSQPTGFPPSAVAALAVGDRSAAASASHPQADAGAAPASTSVEASLTQSSGPAASEPLAAAGPPPPAWDIDVASYESHERVGFFVERFSGASKATFEMALARQRRYAPMIHAKLRAAGLPEDMIFLPLIESWYDPHAYSRSAAVGMWQFMTGTARGVGLRVDWWLDERRDPVRSTDGAVAYLNELRHGFGSVYLAAAAYNGGSGRVSRGLAANAAALDGREGDDLFFGLSERKNALRAETRDYVPKLIAAALVGKDPLRYSLMVPPVLPFAWDSVSVPAATPLAAVAKALEVPLDSLLDYNPQILRGMTPPTGLSVWLRVPVGSSEGYDDRFSALRSDERTAVKRVVTKEGDYMTKLANRAGLTATQLNWYNPQATRLKNGNLHPGQRILIPRLDVVRAARDVPDPKIERYGASTNGFYVVKKGESLGLIARKNSTTVARIKTLNRLKNDNIRIGQKLRVR